MTGLLAVADEAKVEPVEFPAAKVMQESVAEPEWRVIGNEMPADQSAKAQEEARIRAETEVREAEERARAEEIAKALKTSEENRIEEARRHAEAELQALREKAKAEEEAMREATRRVAAEDAKEQAVLSRVDEQKVREEEAARIAMEAKAQEEARLSAEAEVKAAEESAAREGEHRVATEEKAREEARAAEELRILTEKKRAEEEARILTDQKAAELERIALEEKAREDARIAAEQVAQKAQDEARIAAEAEVKAAQEKARAHEAARIAAEKVAREEAARAEERRLAEEKARELAEQKRLAEAEAQEAARIAEKQRVEDLARAAESEAQARARAQAEAELRETEAKARAEEEARLAAEQKRRDEERQLELARLASEEAREKELARVAAEEKSAELVRLAAEERAEAEARIADAQAQSEAKKRAEEELRALDEQVRADDEARLAAEQKAREELEEIARQEAAARAVAEIRAKGPDVEIIKRERDAPARTVFIRLESVPGAGRYDLEIKPVRADWRAPYLIKTHTPEFRIRLTPARYTVRTRSVTLGGVRGNWSEWSPFAVPFRAVAARTPADKTVIQNAGTDRQVVTLEWAPNLDAGAYFVEVKADDGEVLRRLKTKGPFANLQLEGGREYRWCVESLKDLKADPKRGNACPWTSFRIRESNGVLPKALTEVEPREGAIGYQFEIVRFERQRSEGDPVIVQSNTHELQAQLEPGEYEMRARTLFPEEHETAWSSPKKFWVPHKSPQPVFPLPGVEVEGNEDEQGTVTVSWAPQPNAEDYVVSVFTEDGLLAYSATTKETHAEVVVPEGKKYFWQVAAYSPNEPHRSPASVKMDPSAASEFFIRQYTPFAFTAAENPAPVYAWARYVASSASYSSESYDDNAKVRQSIVAGELNLALGYWHRRTRLGLLATGGVQNYRTSTSSANQKNGSVNLGYRLIWEGDQRARVWLGYAYREIPSLRANPTTQAYDIRHLTSAGPQITLSYADTFNPTLGYQFHGRYFYGMRDLGTPNNQPQDSSEALSASASVTYKLGPKLIGLMGYTFQYDKGSYQSADTPGKSNTTSLTGHYLTLGFEFAISDPHK